MRLDSYLANAGCGSRKMVKETISQKRVTVNGRVVTSPKHQIIETNDEVCLDGAVIHHETFVYYMMHKPQDVLSATQDRRDTVVLDLLHDRDKRKGLFPVGRLDKDTTGLLLLTGNGPLAHAMLSPKKHVAKVHEAHVQGVMTKEDISAFQEGIALSDHISASQQH